MIKKINSCISFLKRRILCEINAVNKFVVVFTAAVIFIAGFIITLHGICDISESVFTFSCTMPCVFFLVIGRFAIHFVLGLALGLLLAVGDKSSQGCAFRAAVFVSLIVLCEMIWISVFYSFALPFFSFSLTVFMLVLAVCACLLSAKTIFAASFVMYIYLLFLVFRCCFSLSIMLLS